MILFATISVLGSIAAVLFFSSRNPQVIAVQNYVAQESQTLSESKPTANATAEQKISSFSLPVMMYHFIRSYNNPADPIGTNLSVAPDTLSKQLQWLQDNNYATVGLDYFSNPVAMDKKPVVLTFDDGYQDAYDEAFPLLKQHGFIGVFYIIINNVNKPSYLSWDEIREMQAAGMIFGSHTMNHVELQNLSPARLKDEVFTSKNILEKELGRPVNDFCYPGGKYDKLTLEAVKRAGYITATTTHSGIDDEKSPSLELTRLRITNDTSFAKILAP